MSAPAVGYVRPMPSAGVTVRSVDFGGLRIDYDDTMLCPRPWTIAQSRWAAELLAATSAPEGPVLELCAGAGHLGLVAVQRFGRRLVAVEQNPSACDHLRRNAARAGLAELVDVREATVASALHEEERFALILADPPWVETARVEVFPEDPVHTIDGGENGLDIARDCVAVVGGHLLPGGSAILQLGSTAQVAALDPHPRLRVVEVREFGSRGVLARVDATS